jgi:hypothetical protein
MDEACIGNAAGVIWQYLRDHGPDGVSLANLKRISGLKSDEVFAGLGWLAREGKLCFEHGKGRTNIALVQAEYAGAC